MRQNADVPDTCATRSRAATAPGRSCRKTQFGRCRSGIAVPHCIKCSTVRWPAALGKARRRSVHESANDWRRQRRPTATLTRVWQLAGRAARTGAPRPSRESRCAGALGGVHQERPATSWFEGRRAGPAAQAGGDKQRAAAQRNRRCGVTDELRRQLNRKANLRSPFSRPAGSHRRYGAQQGASYDFVGAARWRPLFAARAGIRRDQLPCRHLSTTSAASCDFVGAARGQPVARRAPVIRRGPAACARERRGAPAGGTIDS